jgi:hypothetical protein
MFHKEASKMGAMLLINHNFLHDNLDKDDKEIAEILDVSCLSVEMRRLEIYREYCFKS